MREASRECPENGSVNSGVPAKARASRFLNSGEPGQAGNGAAKSRSRLKWTDCTPEASVPVRGASKSGNLFGSKQGVGTGAHKARSASGLVKRAYHTVVSYLLGLLAKIKCSICSYQGRLPWQQLNLCYVLNEYNFD